MVPKKILIIQLRRVGDVIFTLPVIDVLKINFSQAKIDFLVEKPSDQLVKLNQNLNETLVYEKDKHLFWIREIRKRQYDWILDFLSNGRTLILTVLSGAPVRAAFEGPLTRRLVYNHRVKVSTDQYIVDQKMDLLKSLGLKADQWSWNLRIPEAEKKWAESFLEQSDQRLVGIAPVSRRETRAWIPKRFAETIRFLKKTGHQVVMLWGLGEKSYIDSITQQLKDEKIIVPPQTTLLQLAALIQRCSLLVGVDNGPKNIAVALGVPTVVIMGPTNPVSFNPRHPSHLTLRDETLFCIGCGLNTCPYHHECMEHITPDMVIERIQELWKKK